MSSSSLKTGGRQPWQGGDQAGLTDDEEPLIGSLSDARVTIAAALVANWLIRVRRSLSPHIEPPSV